MKKVYENKFLDFKDFVDGKIGILKGGEIPCPLELADLLLLPVNSVYVYISRLRKSGYRFSSLGQNRGYKVKKGAKQ